MLEDLDAGHCFAPDALTSEAVFHLLEGRQTNVVTWQDWEKLDAAEIAAGVAEGRPRRKFVSEEEMLAELGRPIPTAPQSGH